MIRLNIESRPKTETKKRNDRESARFITLHACLPSQFLQNSNLHAFFVNLLVKIIDLNSFLPDDNNVCVH